MSYESCLDILISFPWAGFAYTYSVRTYMIDTLLGRNRVPPHGFRTASLSNLVMQERILYSQFHTVIHHCIVQWLRVVWFLPIAALPILACQLFGVGFHRPGLVKILARICEGKNKGLVGSQIFGSKANNIQRIWRDQYFGRASWGHKPNNP